MAVRPGQAPHLREPEAREPHELLTRLDLALAPITSIPPLDRLRFLETHRAYEARSDQRQRIVDWFASNLVPEEHPRELTVLSVGCGGGLLDSRIASQAAQSVSRLRYIGIDPSPESCTSFLERMRAALLSSEAQFDVACGVLETASPAPASCDVVHLVHCLYYMRDPWGTLEHARRLLRPGGRLIVGHAPREALNELSARFYEKQYRKPSFFAGDLVHLLERNRWAYRRTRLNATLDLSGVGRGECSDGLRDFIIQADGAELPDSARGIVEQYLRVITSTVDDRAVIHHPVDMFVIDG
ncbi:MAG: class I SAM-dependent methyltransferase [Myxococcota bacterium]